jgi:hypothetical protein
VKSVKILQMERQSADNVAPAIVMDVNAENATPTATATTRKIYKPIKLRMMFKLKKTHQQRALTLTVPQAPLHPWTERPKRCQLHPQRQVLNARAEGQVGLQNVAVGNTHTYREFTVNALAGFQAIDVFPHPRQFGIGVDVAAHLLVNKVSQIKPTFRVDSARGLSC